MRPTFLAKFLRDGSTALRCRETGERFIISAISPRHDDCGAYRNGELFHTGPRLSCVNAIESASRWVIRNG